MAKNRRVNITQEPVNRVLWQLTLPMILGVLGLVAFNLADTYFVGRLGTLQIAALSFTFPVVTFVNSLNLGMGVGASAVISRAVGEQEKERVIRLSTDSLLLGLLISITTMIVGLLTIDPLFTALGADGTTLPYINQYMRIWYIGVPFIVIPMIGNSAIRALGDIKTPSFVMLVAAGVNIVLDPLLIFGIGFFPAMGVPGAALATVIARASTFAFALYILIKREKVISLQRVRVREVLRSWGRILFIGVPNAFAQIIVPLGTGVITGLIAVYGTDAVAGYGISTRIEYFAVSALRALITIIPVFVGQNFGAKKIGRIRRGVLSGETFSVINGIVLYAALALLARPLSLLFTRDEAVIPTIVLYFRIIPIGYAFMGVVQIINGVFNGLHKPIKAAVMNITQMFVIYIPLALVTAKAFGVVGIFSSLAASYAIVAVAVHFILKRDLNRLSAAQRETGDGAASP